MAPAGLPSARRIDLGSHVQIDRAHNWPSRVWGRPDAAFGQTCRVAGNDSATASLKVLGRMSARTHNGVEHLMADELRILYIVARQNNATAHGKCLALNIGPPQVVCAWHDVPADLGRVDDASGAALGESPPECVLRRCHHGYGTEW